MRSIENPDFQRWQAAFEQPGREVYNGDTISYPRLERAWQDGRR
jgi:hypothetical protein